MSNKTYLNLTGGLGNQLFQFAAALSLANGNDIIIESKNGAPRLNLEGEPDLASFLLPPKVTFLRSPKAKWIASKATGFSLRQGVSPTKYEQLAFIRIITKFSASLINSVSLKKLIRINLNSGVGYDERIKPNKHQLLIGYFQTYRYAEQPTVHKYLQEIKLKKKSRSVDDYKEISKTEKPLVVHIRLGDYKLENSFGILTKAYYKNAIDELWALGEYKRIWIFSDEPREAIKMLDQSLLDFVRIIPEVENSAALTLEVMRYGAGYIIANSSFSWWGAYLSYAKSPQVIAPNPWFIGQSEPIDLIPPLWHRRNGHL